MEVKNEKNKRIFWWSFCLAAILILFFVIGSSNAVYAGMEDLKLWPLPQEFTELYFESPTSLPTHATAGSPISFSFGVHNLEGGTEAYAYDVYFQSSSNQTTTIASGSIALASDSSDTIRIIYTFPKGLSTRTKIAPGAVNETGRVVVSLPSLNQQIDFLLPNKNL